jgi:hypothetical protein
MTLSIKIPLDCFSWHYKKLIMINIPRREGQGDTLERELSSVTGEDKNREAL